MTPGGPPGPRNPRRGEPARTGPYAVFKPRWGTRVPATLAVVVFVFFTFAALTFPGEWTPLDRAFFFVLGCGIAGLLLRYSLIEARPDERGVVVRNLFTTRRLEWAQIVRMQFGGGAPWVSLDLADTDTVAVMAIQKADGAHGRAHAARLSALIDYHAAPEVPGA